MEDEHLLRQEELVENPTARIPICLVLDVSYSMAGDPIKELERGVETFFYAIREDEVAQYSAEISIVTFGGTVEKELDFFSIQRQEPPSLSAHGSTPMGAGVSLALELLESRKSEYQNAGIDYYQPWMVLMTDGHPTDDISNAVSQVEQLVEQKKLTVFPIAIGDDVGMEDLARLGGGRKALRLKGLNFKEFFVWLSQSVSRVSQSTPGEKIELDTSTLDTWASI
jgi:uncharacterized protein YegL